MDINPIAADADCLIPDSVSIPERDFSGYQPPKRLTRPSLGAVSIPERDFSGYQPTTHSFLELSPKIVSIPERDFSGYQLRYAERLDIFSFPGSISRVSSNYSVSGSRSRKTTIMILLQT